MRELSWPMFDGWAKVELFCQAMTTDLAANDAFLLLQEFFTKRHSPSVALRHLREKVEIGIDIGSSISAAVFRQGDAIIVEKRDAVKPDFIFHLKPETVSVLAQTPDEVGEIGLAIIKSMLTGDVHVQMPGGFMSVLRNGYMEIVSSGGAPVAKVLGQMGLSSPSKILGLFKKLRG